MKYDIIVVGGGTGGAMAAKTAKTASKMGLTTLLIDRKEKGEVGNKICGNALEKQDLTILELPLPKNNEIENRFKGIKIFAPNKKYCFTFKKEGYILNRHIFGQRLLNEALAVGVELQEQAIVTKPILKDNKVRGVIIKNLVTKQQEEIFGRLIIDASGIHSQLRKAVQSPYIGKEIEKQHLLMCYRGIISTDSLQYNSDYVYLYFSNIDTPGGYSWVFPMANKKVNIGIGVSGDTMYNIKYVYKQQVNHLIQQKQVFHQGGGIVPMRYPLWSFVADGIMFVGDAAYQTNPMNGGGIGPSMRAGIYAAEEGVKAIEQGNTHIEGLWSYNKRYAREQGCNFAVAFLARLFFSRLSDRELNIVFKKKLLKSQDAADLLAGICNPIWQYNPLDILGRIIRGICHPQLIIDILTIKDLMVKIKKLYQNYPSRSSFQKWKAAIKKIEFRARKFIQNRSYLQ